MTGRVLLLPLVLLCLPGGISFGQEVIPPHTLDHLKQATVFVRVRAGEQTISGSGFLFGEVGNDGYIATNAHVVDSSGESPGLQPNTSASIRVVFHSGTPDERAMTATVAGYDPVRDLAILKVTSANLPALIKSNKRIVPRETQTVFILGFPFGASLALHRRNPAVTVSRAAISSVRRDAYGRLAAIQIDASINPGNSGGPVVTRDGDLVGIAVAKVEGTQIGLAIPGSDLRDMLLGRIAAVNFRMQSCVNATFRFTVRGILIDPLSRVENVGLLSCRASEVTREVAPTRAGAWGQVARGVKTAQLSIVDEFFVGDVAMQASANSPTTFYIQPVITRTDGKQMYLEPARLNLPAGNQLPPNFEPIPVSSRTSKEIDWYLRLAGGDARSSQPLRREKIRLRHTLTGPADVPLDLAFAPDNNLLVCAGMDKTIHTWDPRSGEPRQPWAGHKSWIWSVAFAPQGNLLASSGGFARTIRLWDVASGRHVKTLTGHQGKMRDIAIAPNGKWLVSTCDDRTVRIWDLPGGQQRSVLRAHQSVVLSVAVSPDSSRIATGGAGDIKIWETRDFKQLASWKAHNKGLRWLEYSPDGRWLASASPDRTVKLWDADTQTLKWSFSSQGENPSITFLAAWETLAATGGRQVCFLDPANGRQRFALTAHESEVRCVAVSPDGRTLATCGHDGTIKIWDLVE